MELDEPYQKFRHACDRESLSGRFEPLDKRKWPYRIRRIARSSLSMYVYCQ